MSDFSIIGIIDRIKAVEGLKFDNDVADALNMDRRTLSGYKQRGTIPYEPLIEFANIRGYSLDWLLHGVGQPESSNQVKDEQGPYHIQHELFHDVSQRLRQMLKDQGFQPTTPDELEKFDYMATFVYNECLKAGDMISDDQLKMIVKLGV